LRSKVRGFDGNSPKEAAYLARIGPKFPWDSNLEAFTVFLDGGLW
jgi:hypothetical protein